MNEQPVAFPTKSHASKHPSQAKQQKLEEISNPQTEKDHQPLTMEQSTVDNGTVAADGSTQKLNSRDGRRNLSATT
jgi:hypothetical protein